MSSAQGLRKVRAGIHKNLPTLSLDDVLAPVVEGEHYKILRHPWPDLVGAVGTVVERLPFNRMVVLNVGEHNHEIHYSNLEKIDDKELGRQRRIAAHQENLATTYRVHCDYVVNYIAAQPVSEHKDHIIALLSILRRAGVDVELLECAMDSYDKLWGCG
jgi:hypothetical protein